MTPDSAANRAASLIEFAGVTLGYGRKVILRDISFSILEGDFFGLVGPNGSGKTTILRAILGILKPIAGRLHRSEAMFRPGYVPQRGNVNDLLPFTAGEVVMMGRYHEIGVFHSPRREDAALVTRSLEAVGMRDLEHHAFPDLSGGQKQRVLIARALASNTNTLILDEPTEGMDLPSRTAMLDLVRSLHDEKRLTVILVTHVLSDVASYVKRLALVDRNLFQVGAVEELLTDRNLSEVYQTPIHVHEFRGGKVIIPGGGHGRR
jgi:ABC-type Mn2+/Zn2+ transport system ATPase subunit